jgi:FtsH-binding integral membrane protein
MLGVVLGLAMIFLSTSAVKGKKLPYYISFGVYLFDSVMIIPAMLCSIFLNGSGIHYMVVDYFITILLHLIFIGLFLYGVRIIKRMEDYEVKLALQANTIHITKGDTL